ncbi:MAG: HD-GYP domain-containing protein [Bacillota bacterium]|jgi:response regulator RpfG family c-di-GMP phosphodiesterase
MRLSVEKLGRGLVNFFTSSNGPPEWEGCAESCNKSERMLFQARRLAAYFNMDRQERKELGILCYCYDIGKIGLPDYLLHQDRELTERERAVWDSHIDIGAQIAASVPQLAAAAHLLRYYGECYNGNGPKGLKGREIPLGCRIFTVVWLYDSLLYPPGGQKRMICAEALNNLLRYYAGVIADPEVVEAFIIEMGEGSLLASQRRRMPVIKRVL